MDVITTACVCVCVCLWRGAGLALGHLLLLVRTRFSKVLAARGRKGQIPPRHSGQVPAASGLALGAPGQCPRRSGGGADGGHVSLSVAQGLVRKQLPKRQQILSRFWASLGAQRGKSLPATGEIQVQALGREGAPKEGMPTHSSVLSWGNPWTEESGGLHLMGSKRLNDSDFLTLKLQLQREPSLAGGVPLHPPRCGLTVLRPGGPPVSAPGAGSPAAQAPPSAPSPPNPRGRGLLSPDRLVPALPPCPVPFS